MLDMLPSSDATGVLTAIVSAALFTLAIFFVVRSRQGRAEIETPLTMASFGADWLPMGDDLFGDVVMERRAPSRQPEQRHRQRIGGRSGPGAFGAIRWPIPSPYHYSERRVIGTFSTRDPWTTRYRDSPSPHRNPARRAHDLASGASGRSYGARATAPSSMCRTSRGGS